MGKLVTKEIGNLQNLNFEGILDDELEAMLIKWINNADPCGVSSGSGDPQTTAQIIAWLMTNSLVDWHGFELANFADWVLGYDDGGGWSRITDGAYHQVSSGYLHAGSPGSMIQKYHERKWNIGTLGKEVRIDVWVKASMENGTGGERGVEVSIGIGNDTTPWRGKIIELYAEAETTATVDWTRYLLIFYQDDASPYHRKVKTFKRVGDTWEDTGHGEDFGGVGDFSATDHVWLRVDTTDGGHGKAWIDKLLVFKTKV